MVRPLVTVRIVTDVNLSRRLADYEMDMLTVEMKEAAQTVVERLGFVEAAHEHDT